MSERQYITGSDGSGVKGCAEPCKRGACCAVGGNNMCCFCFRKMPDCLIGLPVIFLQVESAHYTEDFFSTCDIQGMLNSVDNSGVTASGNDENPLRQGKEESAVICHEIRCSVFKEE